MSKSVFDLLLAQGYPAHPDTVIIQVSGMTDATLHDIYERAEELDEIAPLFDEMVLELDMTPFLLNTGLVREVATQLGMTGALDTLKRTKWVVRVSLYECDADHNRTYCVSILEYDYFQGQHLWTMYPRSIVFMLDRSGHIEQISARFTRDTRPVDYRHSHLFPESLWCSQQSYLHPINLSQEESDGVASFVIAFLAYLSEDTEAEVIIPSRQYRRSFARRYGKDPSPVVVVYIDHAHPRKVYETGEHTGIKKRQHTVRGHFRRIIDHPFIPPGTYYIRPHIRGGKQQNDEHLSPKQYRIILKGVSNE